MAVIVRTLSIIRDEEVWMETYLPHRNLSAAERIQADRLDEYLADLIPALEARVFQPDAREQSIVDRWYRLGHALREIISESGLVMSGDVDSGDFWKAVWWYLPKSLRPSGPGRESPTYEEGHKRKDHLSLCHEIAAHPWNVVGWIERWDDWNQISFRPAICRDRRILNELGRSIKRLERYPKRSEFRTIVKGLGDRFSTRRFVNTEVLADDEIAAEIRAEVERAINSS